MLETPGVDVNIAQKNGVTALLSAARGGHTDVVRALLGVDGIDLNTANMAGYTPLISASKMGHLEVVKLLLGAPGVDVKLAKKKFGRTALGFALEKGHTVIAEMLKAAGATPFVVRPRSSRRRAQQPREPRPSPAPLHPPPLSLHNTETLITQP